VVVRLAEVADDTVTPPSERGGLVLRSLSDDTEAVGVVDVEQSVVLAGEPRECRQIGGVAGHAVDPVHADEAGARVVRTEQTLEVVGIRVPEAVDACTVHGRHLTAVVDRLVRARIEKHGTGAREHRNHRRMDQRDRREDERVLAAEQRGELLLDLLVQSRAAEQPRPAGMGAPALEVGGDRGDDLAVEIEAQVVAGREVGKPAIPDPDHPAVDLVDHGVRHRVRPLQLGEVLAGRQPAVEPGSPAGSHVRTGLCLARRARDR
jgi:hypothetical protein